MKLLIILAIFTSTAFAGETKTECPMMREMSKRSNPKAGMDFQAKTRLASKSATTSKQ